MLRNLYEKCIGEQICLLAHVPHDENIGICFCVEGKDALHIQIEISRGKESFGIHLQPLLFGLWGRREKSMFLPELLTEQTTCAYIVDSVCYLSNAIGSNCDSSLED
jgi:hypothetical protein